MGPSGRLYRCVGKYAEEELRTWLDEADTSRVLSVFVGASSGGKPVRTDLRRAQALRDEVRPDLPLGAVVIGERHARTGDEHLRMLAKQDRGCTFFISQVIYDLNETKNLVSDYFYECAERGVPPRPVIFTLVAVRVGQDARVPAVARRRRAALAGEHPAALPRSAGRFLPRVPGDRP